MTAKRRAAHHQNHPIACNTKIKYFIPTSNVNRLEQTNKMAVNLIIVIFHVKRCLRAFVSWDWRFYIRFRLAFFLYFPSASDLINYFLHCSPPNGEEVAMKWSSAQHFREQVPTYFPLTYNYRYSQIDATQHNLVHLQVGNGTLNDPSFTTYQWR